MFGLNGEQIVHRARALATEHATRRELPVDASDAQLEAAIDAIGGMVARDRKLRRPLRDTTVRSVIDSLIAWEVVVVVVGKDAAEARWLALRGREGTAVASSEVSPPVRGPTPAVPARSARNVRKRPRQLPDVQLHPGLVESVHAEPTGGADPMHRDGYEHHLWLEEWMELAVGAEAFDRLEAAVTAHPMVDVAMHMDREVLYVAAPTLHPADVRQIVLAVLADTYDPDWEKKF